MRNFLGIFLFICLVGPYAGTYTWLNHEKKLIQKNLKKEMIAGIDKKELVLLKFSKAESTTKLSWEHSKEFGYQGQMYDIVETEINGDSILYWCWWDHEETALNKELQNLVAEALGNNSQSKEKEKQLIDFFKSLFYTNTFTWNAVIHLTNKNFFACSFNYTSCGIAPPVPPPDLL